MPLAQSRDDLQARDLAQTFPTIDVGKTVSRADVVNQIARANAAHDAQRVLDRRDLHIANIGKLFGRFEITSAVRRKRG